MRAETIAAVRDRGGHWERTEDASAANLFVSRLGLQFVRTTRRLLVKHGFVARLVLDLEMIDNEHALSSASTAPYSWPHVKVVRIKASHSPNVATRPFVLRLPASRRRKMVSSCTALTISIGQSGHASEVVIGLDHVAIVGPSTTMLTEIDGQSARRHRLHGTL